MKPQIFLVFFDLLMSCVDPMIVVVLGSWFSSLGFTFVECLYVGLTYKKNKSNT